VTDLNQPEEPQPGGPQPDDGESLPQPGDLPQRKPLGESPPQRGGSLFERPESSSNHDDPAQPRSPFEPLNRRSDAAIPPGDVLSRLRDALLDSDDTLPGLGDAVPERGADQSREEQRLPQRGDSLPQRGAAHAQASGSMPNGNGSEGNGSLPQRDAPLPQRDAPLPQRDAPLPQRGGQSDGPEALPQRGSQSDGPEALPQRGGQADGPEALPRRTTRTRPSGRHRSPHRLSVASDAPALVLAVPGSAKADTAEIGPRVASIAGLSCPGVDIRVGYVQGSDLSLADCLLPDDESADHDQFPSVIVPLLLGPSPAIDMMLSQLAAQLPVPAVVAGHLGPHPLVAEALHARLAEAGLARHARSSGLSISADGRGVIVLADKDERAASAAAVVAVLLASRLSVPVVPASLGDPASIADAVTRLSDSGSPRPALAPCLIGPETSLPVLDDLSAALGAPASATLGAHTAVGQLVAIRYGAALASLSLAG
jgi:hypothetical protein